MPRGRLGISAAELPSQLEACFRLLSATRARNGHLDRFCAPDKNNLHSRALRRMAACLCRMSRRGIGVAIVMPNPCHRERKLVFVATLRCHVEQIVNPNQRLKTTGIG